jgi:hypothetical protein
MAVAGANCARERRGVAARVERRKPNACATIRRIVHIRRVVGPLLLAILFATGAHASDHIDGPVTTRHRVADLTDLYVFPTPQQPGFVTFILNVYPIVPGDGHFSEKVSYTIFVRRAAPRPTAHGASFATSDEVDITCAFTAPHDTAEHMVSCSGPHGLLARSRYGVVPAKQANNGVRLYAGMRADPFFFNADFATDAIEGKLNAPKDDNVMAGVNVLSVVIDIELRQLYPANVPTMIAVAAESTTRDTPRAALRRLDRVVRPEFTNVSLAAVNARDLRDRHNLHRPFHVPPEQQRGYQEKLARNIAFYDALDGRTDWRAAARNDLAAMMAEDFLVLDVSKPCGAQSFLVIEKAVLRGEAWKTCGGRTPNDDIMDTLFTLYVAGISGKPVRDGVDRPAAAISSTFPYLAAPDLGTWSLVRGFLARKVLGIPDLP